MPIPHDPDRSHSPRPRRRPRGSARFLAPAAALFATTLLCVALPAGCRSRTPTLRLSEHTLYSGPEIRLDSTGPVHALVLDAPSPGYAFELSGGRDRLGGRDVAVTVREPNPEFLYPAVMVQLRVTTGVETNQGIRVFARVGPFSGLPDAARYQLVQPLESAPGPPAADTPAARTDPSP